MEHDSQRPTLPAIPAPPRHAERRRAFRRQEDQATHEERALLAHALDVLAGPGDAASQVAEILALLARVVGARRAAFITDRPSRRVLVVAGPDEDPGEARRLAAWLDARAVRPAAVRAAAPAADVVLVRTRRARPGTQRAAASQAPPGAPPAAASQAPPEDRFLRLDVGGAGAQLGLELADPADAAAAAARLPADTLRHLVAALAAATGRAADSEERALLRARERERERFVSMVVHELRTPLTGLGGYLDLLAGGAVDDPEIGHEFIERGRGIVERMAALVGDLLELSRLEAGSLRLEIERVSLAEACERAIEALAPIAAGRGIRLAAALPPRLRTALADRRRVEQIVTNLAGNACKFVPDGGRVEIAARLDGDVAILVVRDNGPGIARPDRERIFRPFARLDGHERVPGTGLGLPISRDLARAMGGDIDVASVPGSGSCFLVGLPAAADVGRAAVTAAMAIALDREEAALEERAILAAIRAGGRGPRAAEPPGRAGGAIPGPEPPRVDAA